MISAATTRHHASPGLVLLVFGALLASVGVGFRAASRANRRAGFKPIYVGYGKYWRWMLQLGALAMVIGVVLLAV